MLKNINIEKHSWVDGPERKGMEKYAEEMKKITNGKVDIFDFLPKKTWHTISYTLIGNSALANAFRGGGGMMLLDEWRMTTEDINTNDCYIKIDDLQQRLINIPINQTLLLKWEEKNKDLKIKAIIDKKNDTDKHEYIVSGDIKFLYDGKTYDIICEKNIPIVTLAKQCYLKCELVFKKDNGLNNGAYMTIDEYTYDIEEKHKSEGGPSCLTYNPKTFYLSYTTKRNYDDPLHPMRRLTSMYENIFTILTNDSQKFTDNKKDVIIIDDVITIEKTQVYKFILSYPKFIADMITAQIYENNNTIEFVSSSVEDYLKKTSVVKIKHDKAVEIFMAACEELKNIFSNILVELNSKI
jgi:hypothetical protein